MDIRATKLQVLHQLSQETDPITLGELLQKLDHTLSSRSVRRWLAQFVEEGLVEKIGSTKGTRYRVIQRPNRHPNAVGNCFSQESKEVIARIRRPIFERMPTTYVDEWLEAYQPNISFYIPLEMRLQLHKAGKRSKNEDPAGTYARQIFNRLLIDLSYNSSSLTLQVMNKKRLFSLEKLNQALYYPIARISPILKASANFF